jgi:hypothetical protein
LRAFDRSAAASVLLFAGLVLAFTVVSLYVSPMASRTGTFRALGDIPEHLVLLAAGGAALGLLSLIAFRRLDLVLLALIPIYVVLIDLDHLPSALGIAQSVRPAHSFVFLVVVFVLMATVIRRVDLSFVAMSAFFAHIGIDTGVFAPFSPFSFGYYSLAAYDWIFFILAVASALAAGYCGKKRALAVKMR